VIYHSLGIEPPNRALAIRGKKLPYPELKEWVALLKDFLLGLAAIVTVIVGVYGMRAWKRDLVGKRLEND
jgi:hypothetical protein